jgi:hypothetical protein
VPLPFPLISCTLKASIPNRTPVSLFSRGLHSWSTHGGHVLWVVADDQYLGTLGTPPNIMARDVDDVSDVKTGREFPEDMSTMMRIAVAGTGGLARLIAHYVKEETSHHVMFLSRAVCTPFFPSVASCCCPFLHFSKRRATYIHRSES